MKWLKNQWNTSSNFRHAVAGLIMFGLTAAGVPAQVSAAFGPVISAITTASE